MDVLIFKTSVQETKQVNKVRTLLTRMPAIQNFNFDLEDCDNILRIVANGLSPRQVEATLQKAGIGCEELAY
ncbi:hypothetical protein [Mucilaginibacter myungsuensis]|uniref:Copper chaperone CopZ n=1 Tax=Mucilaginibacter myungsuensis TaxID=649104 RepID=A0A929KX54_9SPHI|nr:hypothetical protein [Mucilaginibacter myungsuensis]MBE9662083.1 hypothetical protein [Mucilaginibacter myungsuensis]MDN3599483.1 hypothetical protein [Mucilaginibacter myungsuensis]